MAVLGVTPASSAPHCSVPPCSVWHCGHWEQHPVLDRGMGRVLCSSGASARCAGVMCVCVCVIARVCRLCEHSYVAACVGASCTRVAGVGARLREHCVYTSLHPPMCPVPGTARARPQLLQGGCAPARCATAAAWHQGPLSLPQPRARAGAPGAGGAEKTLTHPWRGCNSIKEAWPWFSTANKANGPAQAWRCPPGGEGARGPSAN